VRHKRLIEDFDIVYSKLESKTLIFSDRDLNIYLVLVQKPIFLGYKKKDYIPVRKKENRTVTIDLNASEFNRLLKLEEALGIEYIDEIKRPVFRLLIKYKGNDISYMIEAFRDVEFNSIRDGNDFIKKVSVSKFIGYLLEEIENDYNRDLSDATKLGVRENV